MIANVLTCCTTDQKIAARDMHDWRALTTGLISRCSEGNRPNKDQLAFVHEQAECAMNGIGRWIPAEQQAQAANDLKTCFMDAIALSQLLRRQRACWYVRFPASTTRASEDMMLQGNRGSIPVFFDPTTMRDVNADYMDPEYKHRKVLELLVSPGLFKRGDSDGDHFEEETCREPAEVTCKA